MSAKEAFNAPLDEFFAQSQDGKGENEIEAGYNTACEKAYQAGLNYLGLDDTPSNRAKVFMMIAT